MHMIFFHMNIIFVLTVFFSDCFNCTFVNEQKMPLVISSKEGISDIELQNYQSDFKSLLEEYGALLFRDFQVDSGLEFADFLKSVMGKELIDYKGGEGSRTKIAEGVYTSTEAPAKFHIPLHHELSCTNHAPSYISFYCDVAPKPGTGQTLLGKTLEVTEKMMRYSYVWNYFYGKNIKYISRHPPEGSIYSRLNNTHKSWPESFETSDKSEVERICEEKGFLCTWNHDWIEVVRIVPGIQEADDYFDQPYWFNQAYLYHNNPRIRGGWLNHQLANILYVYESTKQYDVMMEDGLPIPQDIIYKIYDVLEESSIEFDWKKGDVLIVDNKRALHGRAPYSGDRRILVAMIQ